MWEPWTGCYPASDGCKYCYYYGPYSKRYGQNTVNRTAEFRKPLEKRTAEKWKIAPGTTVATCFSTDFFLPEADEWRKEAWSMIRQRQDCQFQILTKRIERFPISLPEDWGEGYDNVQLGCTCENQEAVDTRLPLFLSYPIKHRFLACAPLLEDLELSAYLPGISLVSVGGETSREARTCSFDWVLHLREQCRRAGVSFWFKNTGSRFLKDGVLQKINPRMQHSMAREMGLDLE